MRFARCSMALAAAMGLYASSAAADPHQRSALGGGFIEMLVTGRNPTPRARANVPEHMPTLAPAPAPVPHAAGYAPQPAIMPGRAYGRPAPMQASLPIDPLDNRRSYPAVIDPESRQVERGLDPRFLPQQVAYSGSHAAGTVVIDTNTKYLYLVEGGGQARRYGIGVGRPGFEWRGSKAITRKAEWPDWRPPEEMLKRRPDLPRYMPGGPENPMGARGLYLGSSLYRIHGTNEPHTIGQAVSSGCIRMRNEDVTDLYERVRVGTRVIVM
jgi:lipoprotein-anchoring transpeptidase ErfK/SrfK